jgi:predicted Zn-dependent protease
VQTGAVCGSLLKHGKLKRLDLKRLVTMAILGFSLCAGLAQGSAGTNVVPLTAAVNIGVVETPEKDELSNDGVLQAMQSELERSVKHLEKAGKAPLYYLAYRLYDGKWLTITGRDGALWNDNLPTEWRMLSVDLRVGSPRFDNTHYSRDWNAGPPASIYDKSEHDDSILPNKGAGIPLRQCLWMKSNEAFSSAQERLAKLLASNEILVAEEDVSGDFSLQKQYSYASPIKEVKIDRKLWQDRVRQLSAVFLKHPNIKNTYVSFTANETTRYIVNTEGSKMIEQKITYRIQAQGTVLADDGMSMWLYDSIDENDPAKLPDEKTLTKWIEKLAGELEALRSAPAAEPFVGPAILSGKAAAVFFHETFGHRIEAQHQKNAAEGKTFAKRLGTKVMPAFISVVDDPTKTQEYGVEVAGHYVYDDEGVPAQPVVLTKNGILTNFLLGRTPVLGFKNSNGHGRCSPGWNPQARQGNLMVLADSHSQYSPQQLRTMLINEAKKQHKAYGLLFEEISGGSTQVSTYSDQSFFVNPLRTYKVYVDGRPDELIRGVDIVGTPLAALEKIVAAGNDYAVFNGECGRESGPVSVSASAPSLLIESMEIKRTAKSFQRAPILPNPLTTLHEATENRKAETQVK